MLKRPRLLVLRTFVGMKKCILSSFPVGPSPYRDRYDSRSGQLHLRFSTGDYFTDVVRNPYGPLPCCLGCFSSCLERPPPLPLLLMKGSHWCVKNYSVLTTQIVQKGAQSNGDSPSRLRVSLHERVIVPRRARPSAFRCLQKKERTSFCFLSLGWRHYSVASPASEPLRRTAAMTSCRLRTFPCVHQLAVHTNC